jgi:hypothetical protein
MQRPLCPYFQLLRVTPHLLLCFAERSCSPLRRVGDARPIGASFPVGGFALITIFPSS